MPVMQTNSNYVCEKLQNVEPQTYGTGSRIQNMPYFFCSRRKFNQQNLRKMKEVITVEKQSRENVATSGLQ